MMSNDYTFDKTMAISKKINEIRGLLKELDNDNSTFLTESFDICNESLDLLESEILPYYQSPMPPLEDGMFGVMEIKDGNGIEGDTFVVYGGKIITLNGKVFDVDLFKNGYHENGYFDEHYHIISLYGGESIDNVYDFSKRIWEYEH